MASIMALNMKHCRADSVSDEARQDPESSISTKHSVKFSITTAGSVQTSTSVKAR